MNDHKRPSLVPPSERKGPPTSFSRLFLDGLDKYRKLTRDTGSATEEAAAFLGQERRVRGGSLGHRSPRAITEALVMTVGFSLAGFLIDRRDPLLVGHPFPWIILPPILISLRHGFLLGLSSAVMLDTALALAWRVHLVPMGRFPSEMFVGLVGIAMLSGQFSDVWKREIMRLDAGFQQLRRQRDELARSHFLLELSHDRVEEQLAGQRPSLREALAGARRVAQDTSRADRRPPLEAIAAAIVDVFATHCLLEVGGLYAIVAGELATGPVAIVGHPDALRADDPLVRHALSTRQLSYAPQATGQDRDGGGPSSLLAALPLVDLRGTVHAVLCVQAIPFFAFEGRNLQAMALLAGHFADLVMTRGQATDLERGRRHEFEIRLARAVRDAQDHAVSNMVAVLLIQPGSLISNIIDVLLGGALEAADVPYTVHDPSGKRYVFILLPAADEAAASALDQRLRRIVERELGTTLPGAGVLFSAHPLRTGPNLVAVLRLLGEEGVDAYAQTGPSH
jgi:hypothetical protein